MEARGRRRIVRPKDGRQLAGVCAAVADHFDVDVRRVRLVTVAGLLAGGVGAWVYVALWAIIPNEGEEPAGPSGR